MAKSSRKMGWRERIMLAIFMVASVVFLPITALLFGNIPVPYSGNINPDGHDDHKGAWPTDYYYGEFDAGAWTDNLVNNDTASRVANRNIPGDGKFDQSQTPTPPELVVSRVDFSNLNNWPVSQTVSKKFRTLYVATRTAPAGGGAASDRETSPSSLVPASSSSPPELLLGA